MLTKILKIAVILWWLGSTYLLWRSENSNTPKANDLPVVSIGAVEHQMWTSIYFKGKKIGYSAYILHKIPTGYLVQENSYLRLPVGGVEQEITSESITATDLSFAIDNFTFTLSSDKYQSVMNGGVKNGKLNMSLLSGGKRNNASLPIKGKIYTPAAATYIAAADSFRRESYAIPTFDPMTLTQSLYVLTVKGRGVSPRGDKDAYHIFSSLGGLSSEMWVAPNGDVLMERLPNGFESYKESKKKALAFDLAEQPDFDILRMFAVIPINNVRSSPRGAQAMAIRIGGIDPDIFELNDFNQSYSDSSHILTIRANGGFSPPPPEPSDTAATAFIQKNRIEVRKAARNITTGLTDTLEMLSAINDYLYTHIEKCYVASLPSAVDILRKMRGDCNEHSTLFIALARSLGIPARMDVGLVSNDKLFQYHAWVQAFVGGRWHTFDPTFGQSPADASHIKLLHGSLERQIELLRVDDPSITILSIDTLGTEQIAGGDNASLR